MKPNIAKSIYIRDGWKCRNCGFRENLMPHHVIFRSQQGSDEPDNLITLCASCHRGLHDGHLHLVVLTTTDTDVLVKFHRVGNWKP